MLAKLLQPENAELPMLVTLLGTDTLLSRLHCSKALLPMCTTPFGICTESSVPQLLNAPSAMHFVSAFTANAPTTELFTEIR